MTGGFSRQVQIHVKYSPVSNQSGLWSHGGLSRQVVFNTGSTVLVQKQWSILNVNIEFSLNVCYPKAKVDICI